jgi:glycosyltransferase involved in cell wall biosynthesis
VISAFIGHAGIPTGFARVLDSITAHLPHDVVRLPVEATRDDLDAIHPDVVLVLDEPWMCARLAPMLCDSYRTIFYAAVDGEASVTSDIARQLARAECCVAFQRFGRDILERHFTTLGVWPRRIETIPHGVETSVFHPLDRHAARRELFALDDPFIVLNANRNQPNKRIDLTLEGFALFARDKPENVKLCLHMGTRTPAADEVPLADRFGIRQRLLLTAEGERHPFATNERLNLIYNACDVGLNTSEKEGWGLIAFEHGATRAAQIVPRHTACAELWDGAALFVEPADHDALARYQHAGRTVTVEGVAAGLERLYRDAAERTRLADAAFVRATEPRYAWKTIAAQWTALFDQVTRT